MFNYFLAEAAVVATRCAAGEGHYSRAGPSETFDGDTRATTTTEPEPYRQSGKRARGTVRIVRDVPY